MPIAIYLSGGIDSTSIACMSKKVLAYENLKAFTLKFGEKSYDEDIEAKNTANKSLISILGGGDTLAAINKSRNKLSFTHLSTAGGAFLEFLEGKDLPGLKVLK